MKFIRFFFSFLVLILIIDSLSFANPLTLPEPKGVYGVGAVNVELSDPVRTQLRSGDKRW